MSEARSIERLRRMLACLEENPPNWLGASLWLHASWNDGGLACVCRCFSFYVPDDKLAPYTKQVPGANVEQPFSFMYAVQLGGFHQELVKAVRGFLPQAEQAALLAETAALKAKVAALEAAAAAAVPKVPPAEPLDENAALHARLAALKPAAVTAPTLL